MQLLINKKQPCSGIAGKTQNPVGLYFHCGPVKKI